MDKATRASDVREDDVRRMVKMYGTSLLRMCYAYLKDASLAEEATQDTLLKAYQNLERFEPNESWSEKAWLMRIAVNTCKDYRRSAWFRHMRHHIPLDDVQLPTMMPEQNIMLEDVLGLAPKYKEVLLLHYYQDFTLDEICQILQISKATIYKRIERARQKLRITLEGGYLDE